MVFLGAWEVMAISSYCPDHYASRERRRPARGPHLFDRHAHGDARAVRDVRDVAERQRATGRSPRSPRHRHRWARAARRRCCYWRSWDFGFKAGLVPLHFWLPPAHAAAPSHVSALMSGVVIKTGIYGLLRVSCCSAAHRRGGDGSCSRLGVASGILGVLWALAQHDMKRLLAYHSVENIGIILMGIGVGVLGVAHHEPVIAVLGFAGGLLHTVNHALFKSLLFLGAGAVYRATGTREHGRAGRARATHARDLARVRHRRRGHHRCAAVQRLRERVAGLSRTVRRRSIAHRAAARGVRRFRRLRSSARSRSRASPRWPASCFSARLGRRMEQPQATWGAAALCRCWLSPRRASRSASFPCSVSRSSASRPRELAQAAGVSIPAAVLSGAWSISALSLATIVSCALLVWMRSALMRGASHAT